MDIEASLRDLCFIVSNTLDGMTEQNVRWAQPFMLKREKIVFALNVAMIQVFYKRYNYRPKVLPMTSWMPSCTPK
jgi:hypothetical protein